MTSVFGAIPAEIFEGRHYGAVFGTLMLSAIGGGAAGPWLMGLIHDRTGSYAPAFWVCLIICAVSALAIWRAAPGKVRAVAGRVGRA
jgi:fucose permease